MFRGDYEQKFIDKGNILKKTYKDVVLEGLQLWSGVYYGGYSGDEKVHYDFVSGLNVECEIVPQLVNDANSEQCGKYIIINVDAKDFDYKRAITEPGYGIGHTNISNWSPETLGSGSREAVGEMHLFKFLIDEEIEDYDIDEYSHIVAHEFGHVLGLNEAYPKYLNYKIERNEEIKTSPDMNTKENSMIMEFNGSVYTNEIEMVLQAFVECSIQCYGEKEVKNLFSTIYEEPSKVIRLKAKYEEVE